MNSHLTNVTVEDGVPTSCAAGEAGSQDIEVFRRGKSGYIVPNEKEAGESGTRVPYVYSYAPHKVIVYRADMSGRLVMDPKGDPIKRPIFGDFIVRKKACQDEF